MSEPAPQDNPDARASEPDDGAEGTTRQFPRTGKGPVAAFRQIPAPARGISAAVLALFTLAGATYFAFPKPAADVSETAASVPKTAASVPRSADSVPRSADSANAANAPATLPGPMPGAPQTPARPSAPPQSAAGTPTSQAKARAALKPSSPVAVKSWNAGAGGKALAQVTTESGNVLMANAGKQYGQMLQYCKALSSAVGDAEKVAPIHDAQMQKEYAAALSAFKQGAADCVAGISQKADGIESTVVTVDHTQLNTAVSELSTGVTDLYVATGSLRKQ